MHIGNKPHKNPNPVTTTTTVRPFGPKKFGTPTTVRTGPTTYTTTTPYTQRRSSTGVTYQEAYTKAGGQSGTGMSFPGFKKAAIAYNTKTGSVVTTRTTPTPVAIGLKPAGIQTSNSMPKANPIFKISAGPSPMTNPKIKKQPPSSPTLRTKPPRKKRKPFRPFGRRPFEPGGTFSNIGRGIGEGAGAVGRTVGNVAIGAVTLPFKAIGSIFKGGCSRGKCNPMAKNIFGKRKIRRR